MKSQKIVAMLVAVAMSSAGFAKEVVTRAAPIPVKQSFESQVFDLDGKQNFSAVELTPAEMQKTQGEFFSDCDCRNCIGCGCDWYVAKTYRKQSNHRRLGKQ